LHHLGVSERLAGHFDESERHLQAALAMRQRLGTAQGIRQAATLFELGELEQSRGHLEAALEAHQQALALRHQWLPAGHPDLVASQVAVDALAS
jgi:tetratricopeptide (TPR) repeat protein